MRAGFTGSVGNYRRSRTFAAVVAAVATVLFGVTACGSGSNTKSSDVAASSVNAPILSTLTGSEHDRVAKLIAQAQNEGALAWIDSVVVGAEKPLEQEFMKEYGLPNIKITLERLSTTQISARLQQEATSRKITTDVVGTASQELFSSLKAAGSLLQYSSPELSAYQGTDKYLSDDFGYWVSPDAYAMLPVYNPSEVPNGISSWQDLINPAFKGKLDIGDAGASESALYSYIGLRSVLPVSYFQQLEAQGVSVAEGGSAAETQKVAQGGVDIAITSSFRTGQTSTQLGVPLSVAYPSEGVVMLGQSYGIMANSPDPAAAQLFEDFLLSKAGQQIYVDNEGVTPARSDVTMPADQQKYSPASLTAVKVIPVDWSMPADQVAKYRTEWNNIFKR